MSQTAIVFHDIIPWYLRLFFHSLEVRQNNKVIAPAATELTPGVDRERPYSIEMALVLPPKSTTIISVMFEKSILKWLEYPPDANHGFHIGPAMIAQISPEDEEVQTSHCASL